MSDLLLRAGTAGDRAGLADLWVAAWAIAMPTVDFEARRPWFASRQTELEIAGAKTIVAAESRGSLLGFVTVDPVLGYIDQLAVAPRAQRRGLAGRLLAEARRISPDRLALHVNQDNPRAARFYQREGFSVTGSGVNPRSGLPVWSMEWQRPERANAPPSSAPRGQRALTIAGES